MTYVTYKLLLLSFFVFYYALGYTCTVTTSEMAIDSRSADEGEARFLFTSDKSTDLENQRLPMRINKVNVGFG